MVTWQAFGWTELQASSLKMCQELQNPSDLNQEETALTWAAPNLTGIYLHLSTPLAASGYS